MASDICIFDAYGTLFDVNAAARSAAEGPEGQKLAGIWEEVAEDWRRKQLEYSWLRAIADRHADFWQVTQDALDWALEANDVADDALRETLLALYWELEAYPEVPQVLQELKHAGRRTAILSNGSPQMLEGAVGSAGLAPMLDRVISVEDVGVFKPDRRVYELVTDGFGCEPSDVLFLSSNGWDVAGAAAFGFRTAWVNRSGAPVDRLFARPDRILSDLTPVPGIADA